MSGIREITKIIEGGELSGFRATPEGHLGGKHVRALEEAFCEYFNIKYAVACNSATSALHMALIACDIGEGDEVVVSPYSFSSSASCALMVGAKPIFVDIKQDTFCMNPTSAFHSNGADIIIPVHLFGHPVDMKGMMVFANEVYYTRIKVIEDCAQAIGAEYNGQKVGTFGDCGIFSFNQSKHISTGEGGMLITDNDYIARVARAVRNHGEVSDPKLRIVGYNYRMCEIEACLALEQFKRLDQLNQFRQKNADYLTKRLGEIEGIIPPVTYPNCTHVYYMYAMKFKGDRDKFIRDMNNRGWKLSSYVEPIYKLPIYGEQKPLPIVDKVSREIMVLDWVKPMLFSQIDKFIDDAKEVLNG